jgi:DNA-binding transcriptional ArsR family regulator
MTVIHRDETTQSGFTQIPNNILLDPRLTCQARLCYAILKSYAWQKDNSFPGQAKLAEQMGLTDRSVRVYLTELVECGLVTVERRGVKQTNIYYLEDTIKSEWKPASVNSDRKPTSGQERNYTSGQDRKPTSDKEYEGINNTKINNTHAPLSFKRPDRGEADRIETYFAKKIGVHKDTLYRSDYALIGTLVKDGFTLERCIPGIDKTLAEMNRQGKTVSSIKLCMAAISQLDPVKQTPVNQDRPPMADCIEAAIKANAAVITPRMIEQNQAAFVALNSTQHAS